MVSERSEVATADTVLGQRWPRICIEAPLVVGIAARRVALGIPAHWRVVMALTLLAGALRLVGIGGESFWKNELFSVYWVRNPFEFLLTRGLVIETNPPLYFILLKIWTAVFGFSELAVRSLSALASTACVPLVFLLGLELGGTITVGLIAATLLALSPMQLFFAHEARVYALLTPCIVVTLLGLCRFLRTPELRAFKPDPGFASSLDVYAIGAIALLYSHAISMFVLLALFLAVILYFTEIRAARRQVVGFVLANVIVAMLASPAIIGLTLQMNSPNLEWIPSPSLANLLGAARYLMVAPVVRFDVTGSARALLSWVELVLAVAGLAVLAVQARCVTRDPLAYALLVLFPVQFVMLLCGVSVFRPVFVPRITVWLAVPVALVAASGFISPRCRKLRPIAVGLMASCVALGLIDTTFASARHNPDWRGFLADAQANLPSDAVLVVGPHSGPLGISYYGDPTMAQQVRQWRPTPSHRETNAEWLERTASGATPISTAELRDVVRSGQPVSLVLDSDDTRSFADLTGRIPEIANAVRDDYPALAVFIWPRAGESLSRLKGDTGRQ
jgi:uncharacterized membrane protein